MKRCLASCALIIFLCGCATVGSIEKNYTAINYTDGIDKNEAVLIAKNQLIKSEYRDRYRVIGPQVEDKPDESAWLVRFSGKKISIDAWYVPSVYEVLVDKKTGTCRVEYISNSEIR